MMSKSCLIRIAFSAIMGMFVIACNSDVETLKHINREEPFSLHYSPAGTSSILDLKNIDIPSGSEKHRKLMAWFEANVEDWQRQSNVASYNIEVMVYQKDLTLLYWPTSKSVVLSLRGDGGETKAYSKDLKPNELDFLIEDL